MTATAGTDFQAVADFPVTIPANARSGEGTFILNAIDDDAFEEDKTLTVGGAATGLKVTPATLTLTDEDVETLLQAVHRDGAETNATTVRGILVMRVFFKGAETVTGFTADDIEVTGGAITEFRRTDYENGRIVHFVWIDAAEDAEMLTFVVRKDAIEEGNFRAEATLYRCAALHRHPDQRGDRAGAGRLCRIGDVQRAGQFREWRDGVRGAPLHRRRGRRCRAWEAALLQRGVGDAVADHHQTGRRLLRHLAGNHCGECRVVAEQLSTSSTRRRSSRSWWTPSSTTPRSPR